MLIAMLAGQKNAALEAARGLATKCLPREKVFELPDYLEAFAPMIVHVLVRFGQWEKLKLMTLNDVIDANVDQQRVCVDCIP
jgi:hypothetical protein